MSTASQNNADNQEIDLSQISKKIGNFFENISTSIFKAIVFVKKNIKVIGILFFIGVGLGLYIDISNKTYSNQLIVSPNYESNDYLYSKINLINSKIRENDTVFLKEVVGFKDPWKIRKINIQPINDVYKFIDNKPSNFELIKLMAEDGDLAKIIENNVTSKNYPNHIIIYTTIGITTNEQTVNPILKYLNNTDYYKSIQKENLNNINLKIKENDSIIKQIDGVLNSFSRAVNGSQRNNKLIYYNENTQLNDVIKTKNELILEQGYHRIELVNLDKIIKDNSVIINNKTEDSLFEKAAFILPLFFIVIFVLIRYFNVFYKKQLAKSKL